MIRRPLTTVLALSVLATTSLAMSQPASAKMHRMKMAKKMRLIPAAQKASFHATPAGGPMMLIDIPQVPTGGGALGLGVAPSTGLFKGVPVIGDLGL